MTPGEEVRTARTGPGGAITRRRLEIALGLVWLLDGVLQAQPYMFRAQFPADLFEMSAMGLPGWLARLEADIGSLVGAHPAPWNVAFVVVQLALGGGLLWPRTARLALGASVVWAAAVWVIGEGVGGLFMGTSALLGAPGAALLYVLAAALLWPRPRSGDRDGDIGRSLPSGLDSGRPAEPSVAGTSVVGERWAVRAWVGLWLGTALLELQAMNRSPGVPGAQVIASGQGEPGLVSAANHWVGHLLVGRGGFFALAVVIAHVAIAVGVLRPGARRWALGAAVAVGTFYGLFGQDLGGILTGRATDPGTAPLILLLALTLWPARLVAETEPDRLAASSPSADDGGPAGHDRAGRHRQPVAAGHRASLDSAGV